MKTIVYYFTGTGNSLAAARGLASRLPDTEIRPIAGLLLKNEKITAPSDTNIGVVYPMYAGGLPNIVVRFFEHLDLSKAGYVFSLITEGSRLGSPTKQIAPLSEKAGHLLDAAWWVSMPDNYIILQGAPEKSVQKKMFEEANKKFDVIAKCIENREPVLEGLSFAGSMMYAFLHKGFMKKIPDFGQKLVISSNCNGCLVCVKVCPVNNISHVEKSRVVWNHHCEGCLACLQFCPKEAISCGGKTVSRKHYHHPAASVQDMIAQKEAGQDI